MVPSQSFAAALGLPAVAGPFLLALITVFAALLASTYIRPIHSADGPSVDRHEHSPASRRAPIVLAAAVMVAGHLVMVALMSSVPVHTHQLGDGLGVLGVMLSAHTLGMFAVSPLTGWWIDRSGPRPVMLAGLLLLIGSAVLTTQSGLAFTPALFLLGYAWNLCYLGGSARLLGTPFESRVESSIWAVSALAAATSPLLYTLGGYLLLTVISVALAVPLVPLVLRPNSRKVTQR